MEEAFFSQKEIELLKELHNNQVQFIVVGLVAATLQGAPVVTQDIDLWFYDLNAPDFIKSIKNVGAVYVPPIGMNPPMIGGEDFELFDIVIHMHGLKSFSEEYNNTIKMKVNGILLHILPLERIIVSKQALNRDKDKYVLPVLKDVLLAKKEKENLEKES
ncbi:hypothetical protein ACFL1T_02705 [Chlamydiota bacterium]